MKRSITVYGKKIDEKKEFLKKLRLVLKQGILSEFLNEWCVFFAETKLNNKLEIYFWKSYKKDKAFANQGWTWSEAGL